MAEKIRQLEDDCASDMNEEKKPEGYHITRNSICLKHIKTLKILMKYFKLNQLKEKFGMSAMYVIKSLKPKQRLKNTYKAFMRQFFKILTKK